jgi:hypothetical protein
LIRLTGGYSFVTTSMKESKSIVNDYVAGYVAYAASSGE